MRMLLPGEPSARELSDADLDELYAFGPAPVLRTNFVSTLDGGATGGDGLSGSINDAADKRVFDTQRRLCDAVVVGAGTARVEGYGRLPKTAGRSRLLVVVSRHARVPATLVQADPDRGPLVLVTCAAAGAEAIAEARGLLGEESVWVLGDARVDLAGMLDRLRAEGRAHLLCEGGPSLHADLLAAGLVDELALTFVARVVGGAGPRVASGPDLDVSLDVRHLAVDGTTLLGLWRVRRDA